MKPAHDDEVGLRPALGSVSAASQVRAGRRGRRRRGTTNVGTPARTAAQAETTMATTAAPTAVARARVERVGRCALERGQARAAGRRSAGRGGQAAESGGRGPRSHRRSPGRPRPSGQASRRSGSAREAAHDGDEHLAARATWICSCRRLDACRRPRPAAPRCVEDRPACRRPASTQRHVQPVDLARRAAIASRHAVGTEEARQQRRGACRRHGALAARRARAPSMSLADATRSGSSRGLAARGRGPSGARHESGTRATNVADAGWLRPRDAAGAVAVGRHG